MPTREEKQAMAQVLDYAVKHPIKMPQTVSEAMALKPIGDNPRHWTNVKCGKRTYRIVFSIEEQRIGPCRHISISEMTGKRVAADDAQSILLWFKFRDALPRIDQGQSATQLWYWETNFPAFNVIEIVPDGVTFTDAHIGTFVKDEGGLKEVRSMCN